MFLPEIRHKTIGLLIIISRCLGFFDLQQKFKNPLVSAEQFYLQYKLSSEEYPINIEISQKAQALSAFKKFAQLKKVRDSAGRRV